MSRNGDAVAGTPADPAAPVAEALLTVKEFAYLFGYHPNSVWRRVRAGRMPNAFRDGRSVRIRVPLELVTRLRAGTGDPEIDPARTRR